VQGSVRVRRADPIRPSTLLTAGLRWPGLRHRGARVGERQGSGEPKAAASVELDRNAADCIPGTSARWSLAVTSARTMLGSIRAALRA
jgi:hypothetical protein